MTTHFDYYIGIDYSGAKTATSRLPGLQVYAARCGAAHPGVVQRVTPTDRPAKRVANWTRQEIHGWLVEQVQAGSRFAVGIDHGFSFPEAYFQRYRLTSWDHFLEDFVRHWPTHRPEVDVDSIRRQRPVRRCGSATEYRLTERWTSSAKSVFQFDVQGSVAKSTHAGLPWLQQLRTAYAEQLHFWPFDGWQVPPHKSLLAEVFPSLVRNRYARQERTADQQDAYAIARWLQELDQRNAWERYLHPPLSPEERAQARLEGWILGIS